MGIKLLDFLIMVEARHIHIEAIVIDTKINEFVFAWFDLCNIPFTASLKDVGSIKKVSIHNHVF